MIRSNPFCTRFVRPGIIPYRFDDQVDGDTELDAIHDRLLAQRRGLIVGPHGSGKSTLIRSLLPRLMQRPGDVRLIQLQSDPQPIRRLATGWRAVRDQSSGAGQSSMLVIDGAEQLPRLYVRSLFSRARRGGPLVLATSHQPIPGSQVLFRTAVARSQLVRLTLDLVAGAEPDVRALVRRRLAEYGDRQPINLREFWFDCYDAVQYRR